MRIVEPKSFNKPVPSKKARKMNNSRKFGLILFLFALAVFVLVFASKDNKSSDAEITSETVEATTAVEVTTEQVAQEGLITFSGNEFRLLYDNLLLPNTEKVDIPPTITGNDIADARIRQIAESRGYKLRNNPSVALTNVDGYKLQSIVKEPWLDMKQAASRDGLSMSIVSAYRTVEDQRQLFVSRLNAEGVNIANVANGIADAEIDKVLVTTSIPGYSKHHSGYTFDLLCAGWEFENFKNSPCNEWLSANNYENAKKYGFIPSYPLDADLQGPDPEAWEYVYVGADLLNYQN